MSGNDRNDSEEQDFLDFPGADRLRAAGRVDPPHPDAVAAALDAVRAAVRAEERGAAPRAGTRAPDTGGAVPLRAHWRRRAPMLVSAAAVVAVAVGAAVWFGPGDGEGRVRPAKTAAQPAEEVAPYWEVRTEYLHQDKGFRLPVERGTTWHSQDGVWERKDGESPRRESAKGDLNTEFRVNGTVIPWNDFANLPADPKALKEKFGYQGPKENDMSLGGYFFSIENVLAQSPAPSRVRAAFADLLASTPGVRAVGTVKDTKGRTGTGIDYISENQRFRLILDQRTHRLLESAETLVADAAPDDHFWAGRKGGTLLGRTTYLVSRPLWKKPAELETEAARPSSSRRPTGNG
ncbi:hypothetical protein ACSNOK_06280 [Streptomyces sp. URMC 126]|uniref:hypothetical protein n=1 Tax=Streptomyces sp. URMC 126 TaxID=3423401 RepID=UPI003F1AC824